MASQTYTNEQRIAVLATLAANGGNISRTERETGVPRITIRKWLNTPELSDHPDVATQKKTLSDAYSGKIKRAREALLDRMTTLAETEQDLFKVSGAFKIVSEAAAEQETQEALAAAIRERAGDMN